MRGLMQPYDGDGSPGHVLLEIPGNNIGAADPPSATTGSAFYAPKAGVWQGRVDGSAYHTGGGSGAIQVWIDGAYRGQLYFYFNQANVHAMMIPIVWNQPITAGIHYLWMKRVFVTTNGDDFFRLTGAVL